MTDENRVNPPTIEGDLVWSYEALRPATGGQLLLVLNVVPRADPDSSSLDLESVSPYGTDPRIPTRPVALYFPNELALGLLRDLLKTTSA